jgi:hypothetical protein
MDALFAGFIGRFVTVKTREIELNGKLIGIQDGSKKEHIPTILVLETTKGKTVVIRGNWISIAPSLSRR